MLNMNIKLNIDIVVLYFINCYKNTIVNVYFTVYPPCIC